MPLDIGRFRQSDLVTEEEPEAVLAAILLWGVAWHEVPAASVPDNDRWLAKAAGYGRAVDAWLKVRDGALRGFVRCSDGRLYNRTLAEKALPAWEKRLRHDWQRAADRHRKAMRDVPEDRRTAFPSFDEWSSGGRPANSTGNDDLFHRIEPEIPSDSALKERKGKERKGTLSGDAEASPRARVFAVTPESMKAFRAHRVKIKAAMTPRAEELIVIKLERIFNEQGHDPADVLDQSIVKGWRDVFPLKEDQNGGGNRNSGRESQQGGDGFTRAIDRQLGHGRPDHPRDPSRQA